MRARNETIQVLASNCSRGFPGFQGETGPISPIEGCRDFATYLSNSLCSDADFRYKENILVISGLSAGFVNLQLIDRNSELRYAISASLQRNNRISSGCKVQLTHQNIKSLPYPTGKFSNVYSVFGCISVDDPTAASVELLRVTAPNGTLSITCWEPGGVPGELLNLISTTPELAALKKRCEYWGTRAGLRTLFDPAQVKTDSTERLLHFRIYSPQQWVSLVNEYFLPVRIAYATLDNAGIARLTRRLLRHARQLDYSVSTKTVVPMKYLQTKITRLQNV